MKEMDLILHIHCIIRLVLAGMCGFFIGFERKNRAKEAGIRTHFIVASASALMMIISKYAALDMGVMGDPTRIAAQVVTGIGFLGAGMIFVHNRAISGLTTAAGIWATSGIGMSIGAGLYFPGIVLTVMILIIQTVFRNFKWMKGHNARQITLTTAYADDMQAQIEKICNDHNIIIENTNLKKCEDGTKLIFFMSVEMPSDMSEQQVVSLFDGDCSIQSH